MNGGFNPIKDLYKMEVFRLSALRNRWKPEGALGPDGPVMPEMIGKGDDIEVVAHDVALHHQIGLDPQRLRRSGRHDDMGPVKLDLTGLEWSRSAQLAKPGLNAAK